MYVYEGCHNKIQYIKFNYDNLTPTTTGTNTSKNKHSDLKN